MLEQWSKVSREKRQKVTSVHSRLSTVGKGIKDHSVLGHPQRVPQTAGWVVTSKNESQPSLLHHVSAWGRCGLSCPLLLSFSSDTFFLELVRA